MNRSQKLKLLLLRLIIAADDMGFASRESDLHNDLVIGVRPAPEPSETKRMLAEMVNAQHLVATEDEGELRFTPTALGRNWKKKLETT
jgi:hypothetical protein